MSVYTILEKLFISGFCHIKILSFIPKQNPQELKLLDSCGLLNIVLRISNFVPRKLFSQKRVSIIFRSYKSFFDGSWRNPTQQVQD